MNPGIPLRSNNVPPTSKLYQGICIAAGEAGALGCKFTWALGGCPAAVIVAPGRRKAVNAAIGRRFPDVQLLPFNMQVEGLLRLEDDEDAF